jgi:peptide deformylase
LAIRVIVKEPDPILREVSRPVPKITPNIHKLLDDMAETMYHAQGVGLAAPQIGILKRVIVLDPADGETGLIEMINPEILEKSGRVLGAEGCLSIPGIQGEVYRYEKIRVKGLDRHGNELVMDAEGWLARIFQHEIDHLDGILFTDKAENIYRKDPTEDAES